MCPPSAWRVAPALGTGWQDTHSHLQAGAVALGLPPFPSAEEPQPARSPHPTPAGTPTETRPPTRQVTTDCDRNTTQHGFHKVRHSSACAASTAPAPRVVAPVPVCLPWGPRGWMGGSRAQGSSGPGFSVTRKTGHAQQSHRGGAAARGPGHQPAERPESQCEDTGSSRGQVACEMWYQADTAGRFWGRLPAQICDRGHNAQHLRQKREDTR